MSWLSCLIFHGLLAHFMFVFEYPEFLLNQAMVLLDVYAIAVEMCVIRHEFAYLSSRETQTPQLFCVVIRYMVWILLE